MSELSELLEIYSLMFVNTDLHTEDYLDGLPNENQTLTFLEQIRDRSKKDQSFFIRALVKFRPECRDRLLELSRENDEDVQVMANAGLMYTDLRSTAMDFFKRKIYERLEKDALNEGEWPIHFLMDYLLEKPLVDNLEFARAMLNEILKMKDISPIQIDWIKRYLPENQTGLRFGNERD
ncbi:MAG: hypothetical protein EOP48_00160 [Sphingobacteriales bacterium]|nr:MAG: hypothetical protein EOP48_00160 [Sphingobacteriales bacterium]